MLRARQLMLLNGVVTTSQLKSHEASFTCQELYIFLIWIVSSSGLQTKKKHFLVNDFVTNDKHAANFN